MKKYILKIFQAGLVLFAHQVIASDCTQLAAWSSTATYVSGSQVKHSNNAFKANWWNQNQNPNTHSGQWQEWSLLGNCSGGTDNLPPTVSINGPYSAKTNVANNFSSAGSTDIDGSIASYRWDFADGSTSSLANPSHAYLASGSYPVSLTVTDNLGASATQTTVATISDPDNGGTCNLPQYVAGTSYLAGTQITNINKKYRCDIAGWCSSSAAWAYEPGVGTYWSSAWTDLGSCQTGPQTPNAVINGPYAGLVNRAIAFSSQGSVDTDGTIVSFLWNFGDNATSNAANPTHVFTFSGSYSVSLTVTDNDGLSSSASTMATITEDGGNPSTLPHRVMTGYWHNFDNGSSVIKMKDVITAWDMINVSFAENKPAGAAGEVAFAPFNDTETDFITGVRLQQSRGKKVLISLGGANAHLQLNTIAARDNYVRTMGDIIARYGFDGMDIDLEGGSLSMNAGDTIANPQTPAIINLIAATRSLKARFGQNFILTMAPETAYVQGGLNNFGGIWGAYLPLIHALRNDLTVLYVQHYNTGSMYGTDGNIYQPGTADFHVAMADMLIRGFDAVTSNNRFPGLRADQVAIGLPSGARSAGSGFTTPANVHKALNCLIKLTQCGVYLPASAQPNFRGIMTWSINWDAADANNFSSPHRLYLNQNP